MHPLKKTRPDKDKLNKKHYFCSISSCKLHEKTNHSPHSHTDRTIGSLHRKDGLQYTIGTGRLADEFASGQRTAHAGKYLNRQPEHKSRPCLPSTAATQARDKNYMVQTDDSLIQVAVRYYDTHEDALLQARAYYYWGCVYRDMKKAEEAVTSFLTANILAKKTKNIRLQSLICNNIGYLYYAQDLNEQADSIYREAEQMAVLLKDSLLQAEALSQQGMIRMGKREVILSES